MSGLGAPERPPNNIACRREALLSEAPSRPCSPFRLPPSLAEQNSKRTLAARDECSDTSSDAERKADGCRCCGLAITADMPVYMGFDSKFCCEEHRCRGLLETIRSQHWRGTDDFVEHLHAHSPLSWSLAQPRTKCARVQ